MMLFRPEHVKPILNGTKTQTRRTWKRPHVRVGGVYKAKTQMLSKRYFARLEAELKQGKVDCLKDIDKHLQELRSIKKHVP